MKKIVKFVFKIRKFKKKLEIFFLKKLEKKQILEEKKIVKKEIQSKRVSHGVLNSLKKFSQKVSHTGSSIAFRNSVKTCLTRGPQQPSEIQSKSVSRGVLNSLLDV